ncbi:hypothetical protein [Nonomuraea sp. NPDC003754]
MRAFGHNNQLAPGKVQLVLFRGISNCENHHTAEPRKVFEALIRRATAEAVVTARLATDILHNQPELPIRARAKAELFRVPASPSCLWLTTRANLSSDDLAVIRHALTAVAGVKVSA